MSYLYDAVMQYALALRRLYDKRLQQGEQSPGRGRPSLEDIARDGEAIIGQLRNHTYQSESQVVTDQRKASAKVSQQANKSEPPVKVSLGLNLSQILSRTNSAT